MEEAHYLPLHKCHVHKLWGILNKIYAFFHFLAISAIVFYRGAFFFNKNDPRYSTVPFLPWLIVFVAELILAFFSVLKQPFCWWPVTRTAYPERLPKDEKLPGIDVFICTVDPTKEPTFEVMNTVVSAMALDYPADKLNVYLSDDGGAPVTLKGMKEAWAFATWWLPFCKRYNVKTVCPAAYFEGSQQEECQSSEEFIEDRRRIKERYEVFKKRVRSIWKGEVGVDAKVKAGHSALIQVINQNTTEGDDTAIINPEHTELPLLVYAAREKRPSHPHNFKAGALNALLRVSSTFSNSPYILVLDCDMYCNDSISARQAMCFHLDPKIAPSLGWVLYPQKFHNVTESDVYDSKMRTSWTVLLCGMDGLQGPLISGTNFYIKRKALYGIESDEGNNLNELQNKFGPSNEFIKSVNQIDQPSDSTKRKELSSTSLQEAEFLACCAYEKDTKWGDKVGVRYSVVEDIMTGLYLQSKGRRSVYINPKRPQFLGTATTNLNEMLIQGMRWYSGMLSVGLSKYWPLIYRPSKMQFLQKMCFSWITIYPLDCMPVTCLAIIPSLCFLYGIPLYPKISDSIFIAYAHTFISPRLKMLYEHLASGGSASSCMNEQRIWLLRSVTCNIYGSIECVMTKLGLREATFNPTNKADDEDKTKYYLMGKYDFRTSNMFLIPLVTVVTINLACFFGGLARVIVAGNWDKMFGQLIYGIYVLFLSFPVIEGMLLRKDNGRVPPSATLTSAMVSLVILSVGYLISSL